MEMQYKFQMEIWVGWEWEWSYWTGRVGEIWYEKIHSRTSL